MNIRFLLFGFTIFALIETGCNKIEPPFKETSTATGLDTVKFDDNAVATQKILIEDFTGHTCGNCPAAAKIAMEIHEAYPEKVVVMALHVSQQFAEPLNDGTGEFTYDFRTTAGNEIDQYFGASNAGLPRGMVNRKAFNATKILDRNDWESAVSGLLSVQPSIDLQVKAYYTTASDSISTYVQTKFITELTGEYKLGVFVIEDSIINWQKDYSLPPPKTVEFYVHQHVLRGSFAGTYGESLGSKTFAANEKIKKGYQLIRGSDWVKKNLKVIAYIYKADTEEIVQTQETDLIIKN